MTCNGVHGVPASCPSFYWVKKRPVLCNFFPFKARFTSASEVLLGYVHTRGPSDRKMSNRIARGTCAEELLCGSAKYSGTFCHRFPALISPISMGLIRAMAAIVDAGTMSSMDMTYLWNQRRGFQRYTWKNSAPSRLWNFHCITWRRDVRSYLRGIGHGFAVMCANNTLCAQTLRNLRHRLSKKTKKNSATNCAILSGQLTETQTDPIIARRVGVHHVMDPAPPLFWVFWSYDGTENQKQQRRCGRSLNVTITCVNRAPSQNQISAS